MSLPPTPDHYIPIEWRGQTYHIAPSDLAYINAEGGVEKVCRPCEYCGGPQTAGLGYLHMDCVAPRAPLTELERRRRRWEGKRKWAAVRIFRRDGEVCRRCGSTKNLCIDHIVPMVQGGGDEDENLQVLCRSCNSRKGAR